MKLLASLVITSHAKVGEASGRLGGVGKQIEVSGKSGSAPEIQSTALLEVYDDFPGVVLSSVSFKNSGSSDVSVDHIVMQRQLRTMKVAHS